GEKRGPGSPKSPRWSAERRASRVRGRKAPRKRLARYVTACPTGVSQTPERLSALRPPLDGVSEAKKQRPGRKKRAAGRRWCPPSPRAMADLVTCPPKLQ